MSSLIGAINSGPLNLHQVYGTNLFLAHAVDYLLAIRKADGNGPEGRQAFLKQFDELYFVEGARFKNCKFELIDAINNSLKHIRLDAGRYTHLSERYGPMSFRNLIEENGLVLCLLEGYRFDYARVVLRPAYRALSGLDLGSIEDVLEFSRGCVVVDGWTPEEALMNSDDPADAIDQMILYVNPTCIDCGEGEAECHCGQFVYDGQSGDFSPLNYPMDFDLVMSRISGAYRPND